MAATGAFLPALKGSRPCSPHAARQSQCCHTAPFSQRTTVTSTIRTPARAASGTDAAEPANLTMHPDALRRRQEAAARRAATQQAAKAARTTSWWEGAMPVNMVQVASSDDFMGVVEAHRHTGKLLVCSFFAPWCQACKAMYPKLKQLAEQDAEVLWIKINAGEEHLMPFAEQLGVSKLPFFLMYKAGECVSKFPANLLKISYLRAQIAAQHAAAGAVVDVANAVGAVVDAASAVVA